MKNAAAIILCAGKGTRMNDDSQNKVTFDCAGVPVLRRIIERMKAGGVSRFVIVIGHQAYSVMDCLDGVEGVVYAYQKEQKGTGHAALIGLKALKTVGYTGPVIISMGDKIIASNVIRDLLEKAGTAKAVWGMQPIQANLSGGRVVVKDGRPYGVVELADAALMALTDVDSQDYEAVLKKIGLNSKKATKVMAKAAKAKPAGTKTLCGRTFTAGEILSTPYANAGLYCLDVTEAIEAIGTIGSTNAQGEIYLTDALEYFAGRNEAVLYEIENAEDMLTYSTKPELRTMSRQFMRTASEFKSAIESGAWDEKLTELYGAGCGAQKQRYTELIDLFIKRYGDKKVIITRAPGRVNLMGRHIDHRGGGINVMDIDKDTVFIASPREDDIVNMVNTDSAYPDRSFSIGETLNMAPHDTWLSYLENEAVTAALSTSKGDWSNYAKAAVLRAQLESGMPLVGMDMAASGTIPAAAGLSSSSSIVVAVMEAVVALNCLNIADKTFIDLCGEGEWFVGSRGGAGDHAAMKCGRKNSIVHLGFKPFEVGESAAFSDRYAVIVANSMLKAKKSEGSRDKFNTKVACYEIAFMLLKRAYPSLELREFRDLTKIRPYSELYRMLKKVPETMTRGGIKALLPEYESELKRIFMNHADPGIYELRGVALYGISECERSERFMDTLKSGDYKAIGEMMKISHNGDRIRETSITDELLDTLAEENADIALQSGAYGCSTGQIDALCDLMNATDGVLGSELVGAGLGGCVIALVEKDKADTVLEKIGTEYYDRHGYPREAYVYTAASGSGVMW